MLVPALCALLALAGLICGAFVAPFLFSRHWNRAIRMNLLGFIAFVTPLTILSIFAPDPPPDFNTMQVLFITAVQLSIFFALVEGGVLFLRGLWRACFAKWSREQSS